MPNFKIFPGSFGVEITERICQDGNKNMPSGGITLDTFPD